MSQGMLIDEPVEVDPIGVVRLVADPMPMPRARARIASKGDGSQFVAFYEPKEAMRRQDDFANLWRQLGVPPADGPLELRAVFLFMRPGGHYGTGANASQIKDRCRSLRPGKGGGVTKDAGGGEHPTGGDVDNLVKLVKDALSGGIAYADDGQVARVLAEKMYADQLGVAEPQTIIEIRPLR